MNEKIHDSRRRILKSIAGAGSVYSAGKVLPESWARPVVESVLLPGHAQATGCSTRDITNMRISIDFIAVAPGPVRDAQFAINDFLGDDRLFTGSWEPGDPGVRIATFNDTIDVDGCTVTLMASATAELVTGPSRTILSSVTWSLNADCSDGTQCTASGSVDGTPETSQTSGTLNFDACASGTEECCYGEGILPVDNADCPIVQF